MSHFSMLVITEKMPTNKELHRIMQPWHQYECTGIKDQYVLFEDHTSEIEEEWENLTKERWHLENDDNHHDEWDRVFWRDLTAEEKAIIDSKHVMNQSSGMLSYGDGDLEDKQYYSDDWKDGTGYRPRIKVQPIKLGYLSRQVPIMEMYKNIKEYAVEKGYDVIADGDQESLIDGKWVPSKYKFGSWTNPNCKWDWWVIGGRYANKFIMKNEVTVIGEIGLHFLGNIEKGIKEVDIVQKKNLDTYAMIKKIRADRQRYVNELLEKIQVINPEYFMGDLECFIRLGETLYVEFTTWAEKNPEEKIHFFDYLGLYRSDDNLIVEFVKLRDAIWHEIYDFELGKQSIEHWIENVEPFTAYGVIRQKKDSIEYEWLTRGDMHMFGFDSNADINWDDKLKKIIAETDPNHWFTIIDCHI